MNTRIGYKNQKCELMRRNIGNGLEQILEHTESARMMHDTIETRSYTAIKM